jgi:hypothetical protein
MRERDISRLLAEREGGECEVRTPVGFIDVLTPKYVYEVKEVSQWKAALGQVLTYARTYPERKPRLYLFGELRGVTKKTIIEHCRALGVQVIWHQDEPADAAAPPPAPLEPAKDTMTLRLSARDTTYGVVSSNTIRLPKPLALPSPAQLNQYADEALAIFDALLDNELTVIVAANVGGERQQAQRHREARRGNPVCYRCNLSIVPDGGWKPFQVSLPGVANRFPSGGSMQRSYDYARSNIPEFQRLYALILYSDFPWTDQFGHPARAIRSVTWANYGMRRTRNGYRIGG